MPTARNTRAIANADLPEAEALTAIRALASGELASRVVGIDEGAYPADLLRKLGELGAWRQHVAAAPHLGMSIEAMAAISQTCLATGFMAWCQNALVWYVLNSENEHLRQTFLDRLSSGRQLGGTALSNPMKTFFGIEKMKLKGYRVSGGYKVSGSLPWVSNLGADHLFGGIFAVDSAANHVMALFDCSAPELTLRPCEPFLAMDGTGTYAIQVRDLFVPDERIIADPAGPYIQKIRAGFVLLQTGMAIGLVRDCIRMIEETEAPLGHVNRYLSVQASDLAAQLDQLEADVETLASTPHDPSLDYWRRVLTARLTGSEVSVAAAHHAMLHAGARGYVKSHRCQRRLRESYFVAIVTPATKQLRLMLDQLAL